MSHEVLRAAEAIDAQLRALKDDLHRHPELSFQEKRTTGLIKERMRALGLELIDLELETGAAALLRGGRPGKLVALRADMDALPYQEPEGKSVISAVPGVMHACGHDMHTACLWGAAHILAQRREELDGDVLFIFQPAEEVVGGARAMLRAGLWEKLPQKPAMIFGLHNRPEVPCGQIAILPGPIMGGKENFEITLQGVSGHPGLPHLCVDVIVAASAIINAIQTIVSRNTNPLDALVCGVCSIHAGVPENFITDRLVMTGTIRSLSQPVLQAAMDRIGTIAAHTAAAYGCTAETAFSGGVPVTFNAPEMTVIGRRTAGEIVGEENLVCMAPSLAVEDFAVFGQDVPSFFYWLGVGDPDPQAENPAWHDLKYTTNDDALVLGAALLARSALAGLRADFRP